MCHSGAIVSSSVENVVEKVVILKDARIMVSPTPSDMRKTLALLLKSEKILNTGQS